ncbi:hypothetical protein C8J57DRAFT_1073413, partial [Mycena rebaudengoi]
LAGGYMFTDYKAQGQTMSYILIDLAPPPRGVLPPFNAYVALSRSRARKQVRFLRGLDPCCFRRILRPTLRARTRGWCSWNANDGENSESDIIDFERSRAPLRRTWTK